MIKIISGVYGHKNANGFFEKLTAKSAPFALSVDEEARLVKRGVAQYVFDAQTGNIIDNEVDVDIKSTLTEELDIKQLKLMTRPQLNAIAEQHGVLSPMLMDNKDEVINAIIATVSIEEQPIINADNAVVGG